MYSMDVETQLFAYGLAIGWHLISQLNPRLKLSRIAHRELYHI
jgi:hypothetical protein